MTLIPPSLRWKTISFIRNGNGINTTGITQKTPPISGIKRGTSFLYDVTVTPGENSIDAPITERGSIRQPNPLPKAEPPSCSWPARAELWSLTRKSTMPFRPHVDLSGVSTSLQKLRSLVLGSFFEDATSVRATGDTSYYGGGILPRYKTSFPEA